MVSNDIVDILRKCDTMSIATRGEKFIDNAIVCFAFDEKFNLYFGAYSDTLKGKNIDICNNVAITIKTLQIHGVATQLTYGTHDYYCGRDIYDKRFPQYKGMFEQAKNELYKIEPYIIWNYNPLYGAMYREELILNNDYYKNLEPYRAHKYEKR